MHTRRTIGLIVGTLLFLATVACSSQPDTIALVGRWVQTAEIVDGSEQPVTQDDAQTIEFRDDGTADYLGGEARWSITSDGNISLTIGDGGSLQTHLTTHYELTDDRLVIDDYLIYERM
ncbi:MAG: lipocalin family protein [Actinomycetota bacterium]|nr:lipocalin family protein [Actinomycetota bacterium]